jgi:hypothetical protein
VLRHFSLYSNVDVVSQDMRSGSVFCLAGANGLGKSTFLAAVNYGFTGIAASPTRKFENFRQYYNDSLEWSRTYFDGRIDELDRDLAEIELHFTIGETSYRVVRSLSEPTKLRGLTIQSSDSVTPTVNVNQEDGSEELHRTYADQVLSDSNLGEFAQFAFVQHFLLTFDERRHLLFWDEAASEPALYVSFGLAADVTVRASDLRKKINKAESDARNAQWQATQAMNRIRDLGFDTSAAPATADLLEQHEALVAATELASEEHRRSNQRAADARLELAEVAATHASLRAQYSALFARQYDTHSAPSLHPLVVAALGEGSCGVCGTDSPEVAAAVRYKIDSGMCPLCSSVLRQTVGEPDYAASLSSLDAELAEVSERVQSRAERVERLVQESATATARLESAQEALASFMIASSDAVAVGRAAVDSVAATRIAQLQAERFDAQRRRDVHRQRRDAYKEELRPLQDELTETYASAEAEFVPLFRELAFKFIGIDLDVFLNANANGLSIGLEVAGVRRRGTTELSESQRFFLDIALRMALVEHMTRGQGGATLFIDTPEGSLDIAYEARAGELFAEFVKRSNQIVMTANINASQMLRSLARECGHAHMDLMRMTDWAPLSEVQATAEDLFDQAYAAIEAQLDQGETVV